MFLASSEGVTSADDRRRLGETIRSAREHAGMTIDEAAERAGMSPTTWGKVERGEDSPVRRLTYAAIERTLGWDSGSVALILDVGGPIPTSTGPATKPPARARRADYISAWEESILDEIWASQVLTDAQKEEMTARARAKAAEARVIEDRLRRTA
jgi:transcriptional regulator with XRE-family HTH domain